jgi:Transposase domain (DUF772)
MYAKAGRPSIPPEKLLRALVLQVLYTVRSEHARFTHLSSYRHTRFHGNKSLYGLSPRSPCGAVAFAICAGACCCYPKGFSNLYSWFSI